MTDQLPTQWTIDDNARRFHDAYERLAPQFGYETRKASAVPWEQVPDNNRRLMRAVVAEVMEPVMAERDALAHTLQQAHDLAAKVRGGTFPTSEQATAARQLFDLLAEAGAVTRAEDTP